MGQQNIDVFISPLVGTGPNRPDFVDTHTYSFGMGMWSEGFSWNNSYATNNVVSVAGTADLLNFLSSLTITNPDPTFGKGLSWEKDQWNDFRNEEKPITVIDAFAENNFIAQFTRVHLQSEIRDLDPQTFYGPEHVMYFSDFHFRVCPL